MPSATTLTAGATAYAADDGKVTSAVTGYAFGIVETAPIAASNPARIIVHHDGPVLVAATVAASTAISNTNTETAFDQTATLKANTLRAGDALDVFALARMTATNSTDTFLFKVKIGSNILMATGTIDGVNDDVAVIHGRIQIRTAGASGTMISGGLTYNGTASSAAGAADIPSGTHMASATIDTTVDNTLSVTCTQSVASTSNSARLEIFQVSRLPKA